MGAEFLFMNDNARPHSENIEDECLQSEDITRMDWPAYSPDLNPIEHVCLDRAVSLLIFQYMGNSSNVYMEKRSSYSFFSLFWETSFDECSEILGEWKIASPRHPIYRGKQKNEYATLFLFFSSDVGTRNDYDEAHFWLNGYVNKQNCLIWSEANPQMYVETPLHPEKLTVWCALWAGGIIGPYFFKNDEGHNVTVNGDRYRAMITNYFIPELNNHDVQKLRLQQDGATCHTARTTIDLLKDTFGDRLISRIGPVNWPPRSCDLTPLDYFLWGYVKSLVYADKPETLDHLEDNIRRVIAYIRPQMLEKVIENWTSRLDYIRASRGSHMPEIIFKRPAYLQEQFANITELGPSGGRSTRIINFNASHVSLKLTGSTEGFTETRLSNEAHVWLNGYANKQNCRIWSDTNPQVYVETPLYPEKLTVWCALWAGGIIGPYFFKNDEGHNVTVNGDRYRAMITNFCIPELNNHDVQELWLKQDGATCHTARATIDLLKDTLSDRLISHFGPVNWPPRSCELTLLDYFLWDYVNPLFYADKPQTLYHLEDNIRRVIADIRPQMLEKVIENWTSRFE
ncbi:putative transposable element [Trichonephila clavipes]|nr:putative transposable element [Trichonephila clavipes]